MQEGTSLNKRGFLLGEETLKIVLAVISITFLIYLLVSLYFAHVRDKELELAKASLNHLIEEINANAEEVEIYNPKGWYISSFPMKIIGFSEENKIEGTNLIIPKTCSNIGWESCICIYSWKGVRNPSLAVDNLGACKENEFEIRGSVSISNTQRIENTIKIQNPPLTLTINYENKIIQENES
ncbi:hypothetical protein DRN69_08990 [Candidatus Pacearchaeota archaeon]|nr:MAG: hypothetical protein DRN69_08990 [Candidatus Pacearchaeota archaeon]